ncbi:MAG TPA: radical SAM protein [Fibrobacteria bacterium]|nr:radical SAM protein [Fibrobacteria bacterium]
MQWSKHNIVGRTRPAGTPFVVNLLSGNADLLDEVSAAPLFAGEAPVDPSEWTAKGYWVDEPEEQRRWKRAYLDFLDARERDEVQIFFVPWYGCNFRCDYCFQDDYNAKPAALTDAILDAFFAHVAAEFAGRRKYLTLFGGEPLLPGDAAKERVSAFMRRAAAARLDVAVVTNGHSLVDYLDVLALAKIREIQVTLDGPPQSHDLRRVLAGGKPTFDRIADGIDAALAAGHTVNLRSVVDRRNLALLPELARIASERGWTGNPRFKTQLGRNYELHSCHAAGGNGPLYSRMELAEDLHALVREHPEFLDYHRPAFSVSKFLWEHGELPKPLFDACTGTKTEWAFDYQGRIFACTATVGKPGEELGTFWPQAKLDREVVGKWQARDTVSMEECRSCAQALACGGGCTSVAKNRTGEIATTDCRPSRELLELGVGAYLEV